MNRSRSSWDKKKTQHPVTRITRSSQAAHANPAEFQDSGQGPNGKQRRKQADSGLAQDLSQMSVNKQDVLPTRKGKMSEGSSDPLQVHQSSGSRSAQCSPSETAAKASPQGGLASVAQLVKLGHCKNVLVVAGAGISTASGIPDFRTPGTGLYANLEKYNIPYPEAIFNIDYFSDNPQPFFSLAKALYPGSHRPNYIHYFIRTLHHKGLLLRMYTQNIDGLEKLCGIPDDKLVEAHGSFATASCHLCYTPYPAEEAKVSLALWSETSQPSHSTSLHLMPELPQSRPVNYYGHIFTGKHYFLYIKKKNYLFQIEPFASLVNTVRSTVPRLLLNRHAVGPFQKVPLRRVDHVELGNLEDTVRRFADMLGWNDEIEELMRSQETGSIPPLISSPQAVSKQMPCQSRGSSEPQDGMQTSRSGPGAQGAASSGSEETDSEADSRSSESSSLSN
uniref:Deacetylase sirtuin-type domain-containing protein n=1 Tax=Monopterus albus TaxID=43700 RepID=A0A3Q3ILT7_MONAL